MSKPVVYEHFGGKEGIYAVVVDREMQRLLDQIASALTGGAPARAARTGRLALLDYIEEHDGRLPHPGAGLPVALGHRHVLVVLNDIARQVEHILGVQFKPRGYDRKLRRLYSQALVGMVR